MFNGHLYFLNLLAIPMVFSFFTYLQEFLICLYLYSLQGLLFSGKTDFFQDYFYFREFIIALNFVGSDFVIPVWIQWSGMKPY